MTPTATDRFIDQCLEFDRLIAELTALRADHFGVDGERGPDWGDVGSIDYANTQLREALSHYKPHERRDTAA